VINKQEEELQELYKKLEERAKEAKERFLIDIIILSVSQSYINGIPISTPIIFKTLMEWKAFEEGSGRFLEKILINIKDMIDKYRGDIMVIMYWFSNLYLMTSLLYEYMEYKINLEENQFDIKKMKEFGKLFDKENTDYLKNLIMKKTNLKFSGKETNKKKDKKIIEKIEYFKNSIEELYYKIYGIIIDTMEKQISAIIIPSMFEKKYEDKYFSNQSLIKILNYYLKIFKSNNLFNNLMEQIFSQIFYFINSIIVNELVFNQNTNLCNFF
jgi:hypothetical protein